MRDGTYIGRFAPSPTGPLHFGSLIAALGSFLQARSNNGQWLVRVEDIDPPREVPGSADSILQTLDDFGLHWDGTVLYQSTRLAAYKVAEEDLLDRGLAFRCRCSRRQVAETGPAYTGVCRAAQVPATEEHSVRALTNRKPIHFDDVLQGHFEHCLEDECGDFVIRRRDGLYAYQLAVTVDDDFQGITEIVRGYDLLHTTARQIHLRQLLNLTQPGHLHLPLALDSAGQKLSKQTGAAALPVRNRSKILFDALQVLWQRPPAELQGEPVDVQIAWAVKNWNIKPLHGISAVELDDQRKCRRTRTGALPSEQFNVQ